MSQKCITLVDYGMANMLNVARAFEYCGATVHVANSVKEVLTADRLILPGVGAFSNCVDALRRRGFDEALLGFVDSARPMLGICVGMQVLFEFGEEFGEHIGLGVLPGRVCMVPQYTVDGAEQRVPHIGWNHLVEPEDGSSWAGTLLEPFQEQRPAVYFVHSFAAQPKNPTEKLADCIYGGHRICAAVQRDNLIATQFHPERSGQTGLAFLGSFLDL